MIILDTETTIVDGSPSAFDGAKVVLSGFKDSDGIVTHSGIPAEAALYLTQWELGPPELIVGHNIKFDIHHLLVARPDLKPALERCHYFDTQLAEYLLTAQQAKFAALEDLSKKYGGTQKSDLVTKFFDSGIGADKIDRDVLEGYLRDDLSNTELVYHAQREKLTEYGMDLLCESQMAALKAEIFMEYNGFCVNPDAFAKTKETVVNQLTKCREWFLKECGPDFNPESPAQVVAVLFGGSYLIDGEEATQRVLKNGTVKHGTRKARIPVHCQGLSMVPSWWERTPNGALTTGDEMLERFLEEKKKGLAVEFVKKMLELRHWAKMNSTYIEGLDACVGEDSIIHHTLNACVTVTGRRTSSNPNMQNIPIGDAGKPIKEFFTTRFPDGWLVDCDLKQLEIVGLAYRSMDHTLCDDLKRGEDIHANTGGTVFDGEMTKEQRRAVKVVNFGGSVYGGSARVVAKQAGLPQHVVQECIDAFMARYPGVKLYQENLIQEIKNARNGAILGRTEGGQPYSFALYATETGRRLYFREWDTPPFMHRKGVYAGFSPTEVKNYPVQSLATGDIVPMLEGELFQRLVDKNLTDRILCLSQVHDSLIFDCRGMKARNLLIEEIQRLEADAMELCRSKLGLTDFDLPLRISLGYGKNWYEASKD